MEYAELSTSLLYRILALRAEVFVVEQNCPYQDLDGYDQEALHGLLYKHEEVVALLRMLPPGLSYEEASIGRVLVAQNHRGRNLGRHIMLKAIATCRDTWPGQPIRIAAQAYLEAFYADLGFLRCSQDYMLDGIPHLDMLLEHG